MRAKSVSKFIDTEKYKDEKACHDFLSKCFWVNSRPTCPYCGNSRKVYKLAARGLNRNKNQVPEYRCGDKKCDKLFSVVTRTVFADSSLPINKWFQIILIICMSKKTVNKTDIANQLEITRKSLYRIFRQLDKLCFELETKKAGLWVSRLHVDFKKGFYSEWEIEQIKTFKRTENKGLKLVANTFIDKCHPFWEVLNMISFLRKETIRENTALDNIMGA